MTALFASIRFDYPDDLARNLCLDSNIFVDVDMRDGRVRTQINIYQLSSETMGCSDGSAPTGRLIIVDYTNAPCEWPTNTMAPLLPSVRSWRISSTAVLHCKCPTTSARMPLALSASAMLSKPVENTPNTA